MDINPHDINLKIVITGPESTGKSTLSKILAQEFKTIWLPEYAREYLAKIQRPYHQQDLTEIALGQHAREKEIAQSSKLAFIDTSFEVLKVWSEWKYGVCDQILIDLFNKERADLYLLMYPDIAWEDDPLRENPDDRKTLFEIYETLLQSTGVAYCVIKGHDESRVKNAIVAVQVFLDLHI